MLSTWINVQTNIDFFRLKQSSYKVPLKMDFLYALNSARKFKFNRTYLHTHKRKNTYNHWCCIKVPKIQEM